MKKLPLYSMALMCLLLWCNIGKMTAQTALVKDIEPGTSSAMSSSYFVTMGSAAYFVAYTAANSYELWKTDATTGGTTLVKDINPGTGNANPSSLFVNGSTLYFLADNGTNGKELWKSDGTTAGTSLVKDIAAGTAQGVYNYTFFGSIGSTIFFEANAGTTGYELWKSDGTAAGTVLVKDIYAGATSGFPSAVYVATVGTNMFFTATDATNGTELWKTDGTTAGTVLVKDIYAGATSSSPENFSVLGSNLIFTATTSANGTELWKSDGTAAGTVLLKDIYAGASSSSPIYFIQMGSNLFFRATNGTNGIELWKTDGTAAGTAMVSDINAGAGDGYPQNLTVMGSTMYFSATTSAAGTELWKTDGTTAGTSLVKDIYAGATGSTPTELTVAGTTLYFSASTAAAGDELWKSDGTTAGTVLVRDIDPGTSGSGITNMAYVLGTLYFSAYTNINGQSFGSEPWKSNGTTAGTLMIDDMEPVSSSSSPGNFLGLNSVVLFTAYTPATGDELFKVTSGNIQKPFFTATDTVLIAGSASNYKSNFLDQTPNDPITWSWTFAGGSPGTSTTQNPTNISYNTAGCYAVTLTTTFASGSGTTTKTCYIHVTDINSAYCIGHTTGSGTAGTTNGTYITNVALGSINKASGAATGPDYNNYTTLSTPLSQLSTYKIYLQGVKASSGRYYYAYIDYDKDGSFSTPGEQVGSTYVNGNTPFVYTDTITFTVPTGTYMGSTRLRIKTDGNFGPNPCYFASSTYDGECEDYTVVIGGSTGTPPVANFTADHTIIYTNSTVNYTDLSGNSPASWSWSFPGGTPSTSTTQNPSEYYTTAGVYNTSLTASNVFGPNTMTKSSYITVTAPPAYCMPTTTSMGAAFINNFKINTFNLWASGGSGSYYYDDTYAAPTDLTPTTTYLVSFTSGSASLGNYAAWIDYNRDGDFLDTGEKLGQIQLLGGYATGTFNFTVPSGASPGQTRLRIMGNSGGPSTLTPCLATGSGEMVDLSVYIIAPTVTPVADFVGTPLTISPGGNVSFTDLSTNIPTSWSWSFTGGSPATSTAQNPTGITYPTAGCYQVSLTATNSAGSNTMVKTCYVHVGSTGPLAPVADFSASATTLTPGGSTNFTDLSTNTPTSWSWAFTGGTPATSTAHNPTGIVYPTAGCYQVTLTATNATGSDSEIKTCYINVTTSSVTYCTITSTTGTTEGDYIDGVTLGTINNINTGSMGGPFYNDYTSMSTNLAKTSAYTVNIKSGTWPATYPDYYAAWIDYNHDGDFADAGEKLGEFLSTAPSTTQGIAFTVPSTATTGVTRMRIRGVWNTAAGIDPCFAYDYGETEDYNVNITPVGGGSAPVADFTASATSIGIGGSVNFTDLSTNTPTSWSWAFTGGTPATSTAHNPTGIVYPTAGCYQVTLTATNAAGSDPEVKTCYINVTAGGGGGGSCDTLQNFQNTNTIVLYSSTGGGYMAGNNSYGDLAKVDKFTTYTPGNKIKGAYLGFGIAKYANTSQTVAIKVWDDDGAAGAPNTVLATKTVTIASIAPDVTAGNYTYVQFASPVTVTGPFYLGIELTYATGDTVALYTNTDGETMPGTAWEKWSSGAWYAYSDASGWNTNLSHLIRPLLCSVSTGEEEAINESDFNIYPNPNTGEFTLEINAAESGTMHCTIINSVGMEVLKKDIKATSGGSYKEQINLGDYSSGIYYLIMQNGDKVVNKKIVIQK